MRATLVLATILSLACSSGADKITYDIKPHPLPTATNTAMPVKEPEKLISLETPSNAVSMASIKATNAMATGITNESPLMTSFLFGVKYGIIAANRNIDVKSLDALSAIAFDLFVKNETQFIHKLNP